ncbi:MAG TPA: hypothetical protein VGK50_00265 [Coriobacteriia bacterium]|jgi:hypothetical protein
MGSDRRGRLMSTRTRTILFSVLAVIALTAVIVVVGALTSPKKPDSSLPAVSTDDRGSGLYREAISSLASGDTTRAVTLLKQSAAAGSSQAAKKLVEVQSAAKSQQVSLVAPQPRTPTSSPATPTNLDAGYTAAADPAGLLPKSVSGYSAGTIDTSKSSAIMPLQPVTQVLAQKVSRVVLTVFDQGTTAKAQAYVDGISKAYPKNVRSVRVGVVAGKSGDDGQNGACVVFRRGRFVFEVVAATIVSDPSAISSVALDAANAFPASR